MIAEISANHNGSLENAIAIVRAAADAGADAVKLQTYTADTMTIRSERPEFRVGGGTLWDGANLYDLYQQAHTPWAWHAPLMAEARACGIDCFSTPFDATAVAFLETLDVPAYKIASFELVDLELITNVARTGKPLIMSTGMASLAEIEEAVATARSAGARDIALLKCTSAYPAPPEEMNLRTIPHLAQTFDVVAGLSDHTLGIDVPIAAVALGARLIEKHVTLRRADGGPDGAFSLEPHELKAMITAVRTAEAALGGVRYGGNGPVEQSSKAFRRSLFVVEDVAAGAELTRQNVRAIRPGHGLAPRLLPEVIGRRARTAIARGTPLSWSLIS